MHSPAASVRVLVVDDQEPFRRAATAVVESMHGFEVIASVASGEESLKAVEKLRPDVVLMDVNLPGISGLEATRRIRALEQAPVVVLLSTYERAEYGDEADQCSAAAFISKSAFDGDCLLQVWKDVHG